MISVVHLVLPQMLAILIPTARYVVLYPLVPQISTKLHRYTRSKVTQLTSSMKP